MRAKACSARHGRRVGSNAEPGRRRRLCGRPICLLVLLNRKVIPRRRQSRRRPGSPDGDLPAGRDAALRAPARSWPRLRHDKEPAPFRGPAPALDTLPEGTVDWGGGPVREPARRPCRGAALPRSGGRLGTGRLHPDISDGNSPDDPSARSRGRQARRHRHRAPRPARGHHVRRPNGRAGHQRSRR